MPIKQTLHKARVPVHIFNQLRPPDRDLSYFSEGSVLFDDYVEALDWAQDYALVNRREMMRRMVAALEPQRSQAPL